MAASINGRDQTGSDPNANFAASATSQFAPSYQFPIDSELTMPANYNPSSYTRQLEDAAAPAIDGPDNRGLNIVSMGSNGTPSATNVDPGMAPPQTANAPPFTPNPGQRNSLATSPDPTQTPQTGDKRKRSKTSRACDECRRKKVRCDAPTESDGTPKTCSNCQKAGAVCEFERKPMKRGPSKGYIKELADRVQQVEQAQKESLRQSIDAGSNVGGYAETFASDEVTGPAFNRTHSFSAPTSTPFASSEFERDRIPSSGAWGLNSITSAGIRSRDVGSVAIAPNESISVSQRIRTPSKVDETGNSFHTDFESPPPAKRLRLQSPNARPAPFKMEQTFLSKYHNQIHPRFTLLPDTPTVFGVVGNAVTGLQHAFAVAVLLLPDFEPPTPINGSHPTDTANRIPVRPTSSIISDVFDSYDELGLYLVKESREYPSTRSEDENLTILWTLLLLSLECENDIKLLAAVPMSKTELIIASWQILAHLHTKDTLQPDSLTTGFIKDRARFTELVEQASNCAALMTQFHAICAGIDPSELTDDTEIPVVGPLDSTKLPVEAAYLAQASNGVGILASMTRTELPSRIARGVYAGAIRLPLKVSLAHYKPLTTDTPVVQQLEAFVELIMCRQARGPQALQPIRILGWAEKLTDSLVDEFTSTSSTSHFNPLDLHSWSLAAITLCEFVSDVNSEDMAAFAGELLEKLRVPLQKKSDAFHQNYGFDWFYADDKSKADTYEMSHWTDCLLGMIDHVKAQGPVMERGKSNETVVIPRFPVLLANGWLRVPFHFRK